MYELPECRLVGWEDLPEHSPVVLPTRPFREWANAMDPAGAAPAPPASTSAAP